MGYEYIWRGDLLLGNRRIHLATQRISHFALDHLGTIRLATQGNGTETNRDTFFPFGREATTVAGTEVMRFTGHERDLGWDISDPADDLDYLHARFSSSLTARFLSVDTVQGRPRRPQSWNRYAYALGNPLTYVDPDGRDAVAVTFPDYRVQTPVGRRPWGHAGIVTIDKGGRTRYYEFGRYAPGGEVRRRSVPDVQMGANGLPTQASLGRLLGAISEKAGQGGRVEAAYFSNDRTADMNAFADGRMSQNSDPNRDTYNLFTNNCATFCADTLQSGGVDTPLIVDPRPDSAIQELQGAADLVITYDPKGKKTNVTCPDGKPNCAQPQQ